VSVSNKNTRISRASVKTTRNIRNRSFILFFFFISVIGGAVPHNNLDPHAEVLLALNKTCSEWTAQWLRIGLENQRNLATIMLQRENMTRILMERTRATRLCEVLKEISIQCRQKKGL